MYFTGDSWTWEDWHGKGQRNFLLEGGSCSGKLGPNWSRAALVRQWPALPILPGKGLTKGHSKYCGSRRNISIEEALLFLPTKLGER